MRTWSVGLRIPALFVQDDDFYNGRAGVAIKEGKRLVYAAIDKKGRP